MEKLAKPWYYRTQMCLFVYGCRLTRSIDSWCRCDSVFVAGQAQDALDGSGRDEDV